MEFFQVDKLLTVVNLSALPDWIYEQFFSPLFLFLE